MPPFFSRFALVALFLALPLAARAQDPAVIQRLMQNGQMPRDVAVSVVRKVDAVMRANAERGGENYDDLRQATNRALFGAQAGPGASRPEYDTRLAQVMHRLRTGLDLATLAVYFPQRRNGALLCTNEFGLAIAECDALIAAATLQPTALPYLPPDDGRGLEQELRSARVDRRLGREIVEKVKTVMMGVPRTLSNDQRGRALLQLMEACPGGSRDRETQVRAWHVGPTPGLVRCIGERIARQGGAPMAQALFELSPRAAEAFVRWAGPPAEAAPPPPPPPPPPTMQPRTGPTGPQVAQMSAPQALRQQAEAQLRLRNAQAALSAYESAAQLEPNEAQNWAGVGMCKALLRDFAGAIEAYRRAVQIATTNDAYFVALGRAYAQNNQRDAAVGALQQAMRINRNNMDAREGLRALGGEPPPAPLPEVPDRGAIIGAMATLRGGLVGCAPNFTGRVNFVMVISGETGDVTAVSVEGVENPDEAACMETVVLSARFPRFTRPELSIDYPYELGGND
ncbi:MAG: tetratricopeptide repeat protein [Sandaracinus sp.]|nr:tetratricopeptide repeat protein [Sandaracinus sp.]MCB9620920.1 tetratricopeptide repeat protein [Sandaracinus sp.]